MNKAEFLKKNPSFKSFVHELELEHRNPKPIVYQAVEEYHSGSIDLNTVVMKIQAYNKKHG